jgi:hypothetical protein
VKTAAEYRVMAEECFQWARETVDDDVRSSYRQLGQIWLDAAQKLDGLPPTPAAPGTDERKRRASRPESQWPTFRSIGPLSSSSS